MKVSLLRYLTCDQGTKGILFTQGFQARILELPWRDNKASVSHIPAGIYDCEIRHSNKFGLSYWLKCVEGRSWVLIHAGNFAGDKSKGYKTNSQGCLLMGKCFGSIGGQLAVLSSKVTLRKFMWLMNNEPFELTIEDAYRESA